MTSEEMEKLGVYPCAFRFEDDRDLRVEWRGGAWAITNRGDCLNRDGKWEYEPQPSSRTPEFFERCRFGLDEALRLAVQLIKR